MNEITGWLIDIYASPEGGIKLWVICENGERICLRKNFAVTFYASGEFATLRRAWVYLRDKNVNLARTRRTDLFAGERDVLAITVPHPYELPKIFRDLSHEFPMLDYYDADIPLTLRFAAQTDVRLLSHCRFILDGELVCAIEALDSPWALNLCSIPLRILNLSPNIEPALGTPSKLMIKYDRVDYSLNLEPARSFILTLSAELSCFDPDLVLTDYGDTWLFPYLRKHHQEFNPNRDLSIQMLVKRAMSYFTYGQVAHRGAQTHLFGRWHIDRQNAMMFGEHGMDGALEQARVTGLGIQEMARKSPGAGITAMQMLTALKSGVLVPLQKQQAESGKSLIELIRADRGGMIYQPMIGLHHDVAQIDFSSMYPSIMVNWNISPETVNCVATSDLASVVLKPLNMEKMSAGLIPQTLRPLLDKRLKLKQLLLELDPRDCRVGALKARAAALKWLLVVCFGYLGYKNARFGKIESYEAVTALSRELLLQSKEIAEEMDFIVLHMYVDSLFVQKTGARHLSHFTPLLEKIAEQTGLSIALDGIYKWLVFPPSKRDLRVPVPNRYFGAFQNGEIKARGIALRRHDTPKYIADTQMGILKILSNANNPREKKYEAQEYMRNKVSLLKECRIPIEDLVISQTLSRPVDSYRVLSPTARAARQLQAHGKNVQPGMQIRYVHIYDGDGVHAWGAGDVERKMVDVKQYLRLLKRAEAEVI